MNKVIIIGCGGVGTVAAFKCAQNPDVFHEIVIASRHKEKCDHVAAQIKEKLGVTNVTTDQVDADDAATRRFDLLRRAQTTDDFTIRGPEFVQRVFKIFIHRISPSVS